MNKDHFKNALRQVFWIPFGMAVVLALILIAEVQFLRNRANWVEHTDHVISVAQHLYRSTIDQETGLRAYLLTHDDRFLEPFEDGNRQTGALQIELGRLISDNPEQQARNDAAKQARQAWKDWADRAIGMAKAGEDTSDLQLQLRGKELMDRYRSLRNEFIEAEQLLREERLARSRRSLELLNTSIVFLSILFAVVFAILGRRRLTALYQNFSQAVDTAEANSAAARTQRDWFQTTLTSIGDAVIATDAEGRITLMNPVAESLTEWPAAESHGKQLTEVFRIVNEQSRASVENPVDKVRRSNCIVGLANHTLLISRSGRELAIDDSGAPIRDRQGNIMGIILVFRDVTRQRALESALQSNERLALAGRLSAAIAHEIHNPLDAVGNVLFLLEEHCESSPQAMGLIRNGQKEVQRITEVTRNILNLHRESRSPARLDVNDLLEQVIRLVDETIAKGRRNIRLVRGNDGQIIGFPSELRQVFINVIKNAVEATTDGQRITVRCEPASENGADGVVIHVIDEGAGISQEVCSKLFSPFVTTKDQGGTGLGLWVSRSLLVKHGGSIRIASNDGQSGTTVSIFLPRDLPPRAAPPLGLEEGYE